MPININFKFPNGSKEDFSEAEMPTVPRVGDFIESSTPNSNRYRVTAVVYGINGPAEKCDNVDLELEAFDKTIP